MPEGLLFRAQVEMEKYIDSVLVGHGFPACSTISRRLILNLSIGGLSFASEFEQCIFGFSARRCQIDVLTSSAG